MNASPLYRQHKRLLLVHMLQQMQNIQLILLKFPTLVQSIILLQMMIMLKQLQNWQSARQVIKHPQLQLLLMRMVVYQD